MELLIVMKELENHVYPLQKAFEALSMLSHNMEADELMENYVPLMEVLIAFLSHPSGAIKQLSLEVMSNVVLAADEKIK